MLVGKCCLKPVHLKEGVFICSECGEPCRGKNLQNSGHYTGNSIRTGTLVMQKRAYKNGGRTRKIKKEDD